MDGDRKEEYGKHFRVLDMCMRLSEGEVINKEAAATAYEVNERTIRRDMEIVRTYLAEKYIRTGRKADVIYSKKHGGYMLQEGDAEGLTNAEALAVGKILLESRAFTKKEMSVILDKIVAGCVPKDKGKQVKTLLDNEKYYYIPLQNSHSMIDEIWELGEAILQQRRIRLWYERMEGTRVDRIIEPVGILFSEFYFYLLAFIKDADTEEKTWDKSCPTIYRIDRIREMKVLQETFRVPYKNRFQEGEFRKRVQFMYGGELRRVRFLYRGSSIEAVVDRLPTAELKKNPDGTYLVTAEVFGEGIDMWLRSQGEHVAVQDEVIDNTI